MGQRRLRGGRRQDRELGRAAGRAGRHRGRAAGARRRLRDRQRHDPRRAARRAGDRARLLPRAAGGRAGGAAPTLRVEVEWIEGDAQQLPFEDDGFDRVLSTFGHMFAPDHERTAAEMRRVCRPGGRIAVACWTPEGNIGGMFRTLGELGPPPPPGFQSPLLWGTEDHVRRLLGDGAEFERHEVEWRERSVEAYARVHGEQLRPADRRPRAGRRRAPRDLRRVAARGQRGRRRDAALRRRVPGLGGGGEVPGPAGRYHLAAERRPASSAGSGGASPRAITARSAPARRSPRGRARRRGRRRSAGRRRAPPGRASRAGGARRSRAAARLRPPAGCRGG